MRTPSSDLALDAGFAALVELTDSRVGLESFVTEHYQRLIRLAALICLSIDEAEDAVQATLERAWRWQKVGEDPAVMRPWLDRLLLDAVLRGRPVQSSAASVNDKRDAHGLIAGAFRRLDARERATFVLKLHSGYSPLAAARLLGVSPRSVESLMTHGRQRLELALPAVSDGAPAREPEAQLRRWFASEGGAVAESAAPVATMTDRVATVLLHPRWRMRALIEGLALLVPAVVVAAFVIGRIAPVPETRAEDVVTVSELSRTHEAAALGSLSMESLRNRARAVGAMRDAGLSGSLAGPGEGVWVCSTED